MAEKVSKYESIFKKYMAKMSSLFSSRACMDVYEQIRAGKSKYLKYEMTESSSFDMEWIKEIEDCIFDLGEIIKNPKKTTKTEETIVPAELARRTNATSVRHLASHTQFIKEIDEKGNVTPSKILNIGAEDDIATYENRFIATLIRRLVLFIEKRYEYINEFAELKDAEVLMVKNKSTVDGKEVEIETKVRILSDNEVTGTGQSSSYIQRIKEVRRYVRFYYNSDFMKTLKTERDVRNPILQTNIIRKNPLYRKAYQLYKFIETYDTLGVNFKINEKYLDLSEKEMDEINATLLANFLMVKGKDPEKGALKDITKQYKPKVLVSMDEEEFIYGDLVKGPIEFVRVDEAYTSYLETPIPNIPDKPKKEEKEYYEEELRLKQEKKDLLKAEKALLARKAKEQKEWNKKVEKIIAQRLKEEAEARRREEEAFRKAEEARIAAAREELRKEAKEHKLEEAAEARRENPMDAFESTLKALSEQAKEDLLEEEAQNAVEENAPEEYLEANDTQNEENSLLEGSAEDIKSKENVANDNNVESSLGESAQVEESAKEENSEVQQEVSNEDIKEPLESSDEIEQSENSNQSSESEENSANEETSNSIEESREVQSKDEIGEDISEQNDNDSANLDESNVQEEPSIEQDNKDVSEESAQQKERQPDESEPSLVIENNESNLKDNEEEKQILVASENDGAQVELISNEEPSQELDEDDNSIVKEESNEKEDLTQVELVSNDDEEASKEIVANDSLESDDYIKNVEEKDNNNLSKDSKENEVANEQIGSHESLQDDDSLDIDNSSAEDKDGKISRERFGKVSNRNGHRHTKEERKQLREERRAKLKEMEGSHSTNRKIKSRKH